RVARPHGLLVQGPAEQPARLGREVEPPRLVRDEWPAPHVDPYRSGERDDGAAVGRERNRHGTGEPSDGRRPRAGRVHRPSPGDRPGGGPGTPAPSPLDAPCPPLDT